MEIIFCVSLLVALLIIMIRALLIAWRGLRRNGEQTENHYRSSDSMKKTREEFLKKIKK